MPSRRSVSHIALSLFLVAAAGPASGSPPTTQPEDGQAELVVGYSCLGKHADYRGAAVDASFYALNFPRHRATAAVTWKIGSGWELRLDNEYRVQEPNPLRTAGGDHAFLSAVGLHYVPSWAPNLEWSLLVDNVWNSSFQEVPAVPASRRQLAAGVGFRW